MYRPPGRLANRVTAAWLLVVFAPAVCFSQTDEPPTLTIDAGGHTAVITALLPLDDGTLLSGSFDNTIRHWDLKTGQTLRIIRGQVGSGRRGQVNALALTPDARLLVVGGWFDNDERGRHVIRLYDWPRGTLVGLLEGHDRPVRSLAISPDGQFLASGDYGGMLRFWKRTGEGFTQLIFVQAHTDRCANLAFDPTGGNLLVSAGYDGIARFWTFGPEGIRERNAIRPLSVNFVYGMAFRSDGAVLAFGGATSFLNEAANNGEVRFYDRTGKSIGQPITLRQTGVTSLAFSPDGRRLAVGCGYPGTDTRAFIYSFPENRQVCEFGGHDNTINAIRFLQDGRTLASVGSYDNAIHRWDSTSAKPLPKLGGRSRFYWNAGVSSDGNTFYWGSSLYDPKGLFNLEKANERGPLDWGLSLTPTGPELVPAPEGNVLRGISTLNGSKLERFQDERWQFVRLLPDGPKMTSQRDRDVIFGATFLPHTNGAKLGAKTPVLVAGGESLGLFDAATGRRIHELKGHVGQVLAVAPSPKGDFAVSTGGDQTLRLWHLPSGQLRLSVFQAGDDWVAWTPKGFYAASPQGDRLIGWQINRGEGRDPEHYKAAQFSKLLYRPDVIRSILEGEPPDPGPGVDKIGEIVPPDVQVLEPVAGGTGPVRLAENKFEVRALARSKGKFPITELRLLLDGRPYEGKLGLQQIARPRLGAVTASWTVELEPGTHHLAVQAKTSVSTAVSPAVPVSFAIDSRLPNMYVLAIGISKYPGNLKLNYAAKDAQALERVLREKGGSLREVQTRLLTDEQATRRNVMSGLTWLKREMSQGDVGVIFFSGHGMKDESDNFYLCPVDVDPQDLLTTGVPGTVFRDFLASVPGKVIAILDGCHSGEIGEKVNRKSLGKITDDLVRDLINQDVGVVVLSSSRGDEVSLESNEHRQGYFTLALTQGLAGAADTDRDGIVDLRELDPYVREQVPRLTGGRQNPVTSMPPDFTPPPLTMLGNAASRSGSGQAIARLNLAQ